MKPQAASGYFFRRRSGAESRFAFGGWCQPAHADAAPAKPLGLGESAEAPGRLTSISTGEEHLKRRRATIEQRGASILSTSCRGPRAAVSESLAAELKCENDEALSAWRGRLVVPEARLGAHVVSLGSVEAAPRAEEAPRAATGYGMSSWHARVARKGTIDSSKSIGGNSLEISMHCRASLMGTRYN